MNWLTKAIKFGEKIKSLYSNLDTVSFWNIKNEIKLLENRGYSTKQIETK